GVVIVHKLKGLPGTDILKGPIEHFVPLGRGKWPQIEFLDHGKTFLTQAAVIPLGDVDHKLPFGFILVDPSMPAFELIDENIVDFNGILTGYQFHGGILLHHTIAVKDNLFPLFFIRFSKVQQGGYPFHFNSFGRFQTAYPHPPFPSTAVQVFPAYHIPVNGAELIEQRNWVVVVYKIKTVAHGQVFNELDQKFVPFDRDQDAYVQGSLRIFFQCHVYWVYLLYIIFSFCLIDQVSHSVGDRIAQGTHLTVPENVFHQFPGLLVAIVYRTGPGGRTGAQTQAALGKDGIPFDGTYNIDYRLFLLVPTEIKPSRGALEAIDYFPSGQLLQDLANGMLAGIDACGNFPDVGLFALPAFSREVDDRLDGRFTA